MNPAEKNALMQINGLREAGDQTLHPSNPSFVGFDG
jgi:hypothetical protein